MLLIKRLAQKLDWSGKSQHLIFHKKKGKQNQNLKLFVYIRTTKPFKYNHYGSSISCKGNHSFTHIS